jgi:hypothetical protein
MRKNIVATLTFLFVSILTLTGCGSTSNTGGDTETTVVVEMQENKIILQPNGTDFTLSLPFTKKLDSTYRVELNNFTLAVSGCTISTGIAKVAALRWGSYSATTETIPNDGDDHNVTLTLGISDFIAPLIGVDIVPESIVSSSSACDLNTSFGSATNLHTDENGTIRVQISTHLSSDAVADCDITWSATQSGIYREY